MAGTVSWMSASRMITPSTQPPRKPASRPSSTPVVTDSTMAASPIISDTRVPQRMAEKTSRPWLSVPSRCAALPPAFQAGGVNASIRLSDFTSNGL